MGKFCRIVGLSESPYFYFDFECWGHGESGLRLIWNE